MKVYEIEELLARYYDGKTSRAEEKELKRFFTEEDVPDHLLSEKELFLRLSVLPVPGEPGNLKNKLDRLIDEWDTCEQHKEKAGKRIRTVRLQWIGSIAASLLILFSTGIYLYASYNVPVPQDTCATPEEAYAQTRKALLMFSSTLNKGIEQVEKVQATTGKIQENLNEQLERIKN